MQETAKGYPSSLANGFPIRLLVIDYLLACFEIHLRLPGLGLDCENSSSYTITNNPLRAPDGAVTSCVTSCDRWWHLVDARLQGTRREVRGGKEGSKAGMALGLAGEEEDACHLTGSQPPPKYVSHGDQLSFRV